MTVELLWAVIAAAAVVISLSFGLIAWAVVQLAHEAARATRSGELLVATLRDELPETLAALERAAASLEQLAGGGGPRLVTLDEFAHEGQATMVAVRELAASLNDITRGPADTVKGVGKSARMMGEGIAHGADRIRRVISGGSEDPAGPHR